VTARAKRFADAYFDAAPVLVPIYAIVVAVVVGAVIILLIGDNPVDAYWALLRGMFGSGDRTGASLAKSTPYVGAALAVAFAFRAGLFNIGAQGQLLVGAITAAWLGTWGFTGHLPRFAGVAFVLLAGILGGGLYGAIPGALKAKTGAHEVITTIMLNNIAILLTRWCVASTDPVIMKDLTASAPQSRVLPRSARMPVFFDRLPPPLHLGAVLMLVAVVFAWFVLQRTTTGFEVRSVGANPHAARYAGINVNRTTVLVMAFAGAFAGFAGAAEISGTWHAFNGPDIFAGVGFDAIAIALLARANPFACVPAAILWGSMLSGAPAMQQETGLSIDIVRIVQALVLLFVAADAIVRYMFGLRHREEGPGAMKETRLGANWGST
jgi:simple sugar transport system permease protein